MPVPKSIRTPIPDAQHRRRICLNTSPDDTLVGYLGSDNISADLTPQASITESPADSGNYSAIINVSTMGGSLFFRGSIDGLMVVP